MKCKIFNIFKILDLINFSVYVSDIETNKIIYINKKAKNECSCDLLGKTRDEIFKNTINHNRFFIKSIIKQYDLDKYMDISIFVNADSTLRVVDEVLNKIIIDDENLYKYECMLTSINRSFEDMKNKSELFLVFQPKINVQTLNITGYEVLSRWKHREYGYISPMDFIPFFISMNEIKEFDLFVIANALEFQKELIENNIYQQCSVNLSIISLNDIDVLNKICDLVDNYNISANSIIIEILEHRGLKYNENTRENLKILRNKGFKISLDDFGTGHSSLSRLYNLEIDELKIAKEFLVDITENIKQKNILKAIFNLASDLNVETVVEGVEKQEIFELIKTIGFSNTQGYFHSKPLKKDEYINFAKQKYNHIKESVSILE